MAPVVRRPTAAPSAEFVSFGKLATYSGGFILPEGDYALEFNVVIQQPNEKAKTQGPGRLGLQLNAYPLAGGDPLPQFLSLGSKAHESYGPDPETGKKIQKLANGAGQPLSNKTNGYLFIKSLYDCGLPEGTFDDDVSVLDGIWVHTQNVPEPEDRKNFAAATGEAAGEERRGNNLVPVVMEIKDDGKPWEGTGGFPEAGAPVKPAVAAKSGVKVAPKPAAPAARRPAPAAPVEPEGEDTEGVEAVALAAITNVLEKFPSGMPKLKLRVETFKQVEDAGMKQAVTDLFSTDDGINGLLGQLGYALKGTNVVAQ